MALMWVIGFALLGALLGLFRRAMLVGDLFLGRVAFCYAAASLLICVLISPTNLPGLLLSIMAIGTIAGATTFARALGFELVFPRTKQKKGRGR